jgi:glucose/arabinose dehydrogenase
MRVARLAKMTLLASISIMAFAGTMACKGAESANAQGPATAANLPAHVGALANQSPDFDQVGDHYQTGDAPFWVRPGFKVTLVGSKLGIARFLEFDDKGVLYMSRPGPVSDVVILNQQNGVYTVGSTFYQAPPKTNLQGLCFHDGWMYIAEAQKIVRAKDTNGDGVADKIETVLSNLAGGNGHWWRSLLVTDDAIYSSVGDPSNISDQTDTDREKIFKYALDGSNRILFASGIRNTEKLRLRPGTNEVFGGDQGSDWLGKDYGAGEREYQQPITDFNPPDEFNHYIQGGFYGHPFITGNRVPRTEYWNRADLLDLAEKTIPPAWCFGPHWAVDGFMFYTGKQFPADCDGDAFCCLHGSWNRSIRSGYRVERICFDKVTGLPYGSQLIVGCLSTQKNVLARPVDAAQAPDGSLLFTSDSNRSLYRITYVGGA